MTGSVSRYSLTANLPSRLWISSGQTVSRQRKRAVPLPASQPKSTKKAATASSTSSPPENNPATHAKHASDPATVDTDGHPVKKDGTGRDSVTKKTSKKTLTPLGGGAASVPVSNTTDDGNKEFRDEEDPQADTKTILIALCASLGGLACCFCFLLGLTRVAGCCYIRRLQNRRHHRDVLPVEHFVVVCEPSSLDSKKAGTPKLMRVSAPLDGEREEDGATAPRVLSQFWNVPETKNSKKTASRGFFRNQRQDSTGPYISSPMDHVSVEQPYSPRYGQPMPPSPCRSKRMPSPVLPASQAALTMDMPYDYDDGAQHPQGHRKQSRPDPIDTGHFGNARSLSPSTTPYRSHAISPDEGYHSAVDRTYHPSR
ncbi:unnamed protein product [Mortierella alpina]